MEILGIDIGGSGIKGAPVDVVTGRFTRDRMRVETPAPAAPRPVVSAVAQIVRHFDWTGPVGVTFPGVVTDGVTRTAVNLTAEWEGLAARDLLADECGTPVTLLNDADAAGVAEMAHGAGRGRSGTVLLVTLGTGVGTALFNDGTLVPNTELGHIEIRGKDAERRASAHAREVHDWSWHKWAGKLEEYLRRVEDLLWPSLIIIGGGVSKRAEHFLPHLKDVRAEVVAAELHNDAGIVGAAMAAAPRSPAG
ncbi:polyphosphate--glucose phosphotransferase [Actinoallomurus iriomotensis]|uniref:Polyphosphate glucokinase n=1 Tax=Actinoallomurus iriomotensis TaxID=478107 RepID=A0A9W6RZL1_9ACTN|nr:ROK family protein [Actinoallomurus iriomotensis]GLY82982.1 polyphosphate glucokinase [Actinoallomurus iriomotensis]